VLGLLLLQVMGDKGFNEKNFKLMKETVEADKAALEAAGDEGGDAAAVKQEDGPDGRKKRGGWALCELRWLWTEARSRSTPVNAPRSCPGH
jgi:hypothetical protein